MPRVAPNLPAENDLLCESCGYTLNGLPADGNCPECGNPVAESSAVTARQPTVWELSPAAGSFLRTSVAVIFTPSRFFRSTTTRPQSNQKTGDTQTPPDRAATFARIHITIASLLFAGAAVLHTNWFIGFGSNNSVARVSVFAAWAVVSVVTYVSMLWITRIAARLSAWEAAYRGIRLPYEVVLRGLNFHAAHYLPVALIGFATVAGFQIASIYQPIYWALHATVYLYVLSGEVIICAGYLFNTYWIGMRNMMYANH